MSGTEYGPKTMKMPILASSNQAGNGLESKLFQSGVYCPYAKTIWPTKKQKSIICATIL